MEPKLEEIPKEELIQLIMKLNKRNQVMEQKGKEILKKSKVLLSERQKLIGLIEAVVQLPLQPVPSDNDLDFNVVEISWNEWINTRNLHLSELERKLQIAESNSRPVASNNSNSTSNQVDTQNIDQPKVVDNLIDLDEVKEESLTTNPEINLENVRSFLLNLIDTSLFLI
jgi:hypothetical protein